MNSLSLVSRAMRRAVAIAAVVFLGLSNISAYAETCQAGYSTGLPPVVGSPSNMSIDTRVCQAVCSSMHGSPCSCPYGQHFDAGTGQCVASCGPSATWQHTPGAKWQEILSTGDDAGNVNDTGTELFPDPGVCTCPSGQEYVTAQSACMTRA